MHGENEACGSCMWIGKTEDEIKNEIRSVAEEGATAAIKKLGLADEHASEDLQTMRSAVKNWKSFKTDLWAVTKKVIIWLIVGYIIIKFDLVQYFKFGKIS